MSHGEFSRPDFVVLGATIPEGVVLVVSDEMTYAELRMARDEDPEPLDFYLSGPSYLGRREIEFRGRMRTVVYVFGQTYAEAFARLSGRFDPSGGRLAEPAGELPPGRLEIEGRAL